MPHEKQEREYEVVYTVKIKVRADSEEEAAVIADKRLREYPEQHTGAHWRLQSVQATSSCSGGEQA